MNEIYEIHDSDDMGGKKTKTKKSMQTCDQKRLSKI